MISFDTITIYCKSLECIPTEKKGITSPPSGVWLTFMLDLDEEDFL